MSNFSYFRQFSCSVSSCNRSEFIEELMQDSKEDVRQERNIQPLSDDYIKFIRFARLRIEQAGREILGLFPIIPVFQEQSTEEQGESF